MRNPEIVVASTRSMAPSRLSRRPLTEERRESESNVVLIIKLYEWACAEERGGEGTTDK